MTQITQKKKGRLHRTRSDVDRQRPSSVIVSESV